MYVYVYVYFYIVFTWPKLWKQTGKNAFLSLFVHM